MVSTCITYRADGMAEWLIVDRPATPKFRFNQPANNMDNFANFWPHVHLTPMLIDLHVITISRG